MSEDDALERRFEDAIHAEKADRDEQTRQFWIQLGMPASYSYEDGLTWAETSQKQRDSNDAAWRNKVTRLERMIEEHQKQRMLDAGFSADELKVGVYLQCMPSYVNRDDPRWENFNAGMKSMELEQAAMFRALGCSKPVWPEIDTTEPVQASESNPNNADVDLEAGLRFLPHVLRELKLRYLRGHFTVDDTEIQSIIGRAVPEVFPDWKKDFGKTSAGGSINKSFATMEGRFRQRFVAQWLFDNGYIVRIPGTVAMHQVLAKVVEITQANEVTAPYSQTSQGNTEVEQLSRAAPPSAWMNMADPAERKGMHHEIHTSVTAGGRFNDLLTSEELATLAGVARKTLQNKISESRAKQLPDTPSPTIKGRGSQLDQYSYATCRPFLARIWPGRYRDNWFPESVVEAKKIIASNSRSSG